MINQKIADEASKLCDNVAEEDLVIMGFIGHSDNDAQVLMHGSPAKMSAILASAMAQDECLKDIVTIALKALSASERPTPNSKPDFSNF